MGLEFECFEHRGFHGRVERGVGERCVVERCAVIHGLGCPFCPGEWPAGLGFDEVSELLAASVEVGADGADGQAQGERDVLVAALLLMIKDENGSLLVRELHESAVDGFEDLLALVELLGVGFVRGEGFDEGGGVVVGVFGGAETVGAILAAALPLILGDINDDAVEVGGELGVALKVDEPAVEAEEDLLGQILEAGVAMRTGAGEAQERPEDEGLVLADDVLEVGRGMGFVRQGWVRPPLGRKVSANDLKLTRECAVLGGVVQNVVVRRLVMMMAMMDMGEAFHSPFIVPVAACAMVLGIVIASKISEVRKRQLEYEERMGALAKGLPLPPLESESRHQMWAAMNGAPMQQVAEMQQIREAQGIARRRGGIRRAGIILVTGAVGVALFFASLAMILGERDVYAGVPCALIPFAIGAGLLIDARINSKEQEEAEAAAAVKE